MNEHAHLTEDVLLDALYGIAGEETQAHVKTCAACAGRLREWRQRANAEGMGDVSDEFLAAQRREIYKRIEQPSHRLWWWAPALAVAAGLVVGVFVYAPHAPDPARTPAASGISDAQLFNDVYSIERTAEPSATAPVRALFEEQAR